MEPFLGDRYGNPSGSHALARDAVRAVDEARERVAGLVGCAPGEVVFTSGGTEADNHAVTGGIPVRSGIPVCTAVEHPAVLEPVEVLGGATVAVDGMGRVRPGRPGPGAGRPRGPHVGRVGDAGQQRGRDA